MLCSLCAVKRPPLVTGLQYVATGVYSTVIYTLDAYPYTGKTTQKYDTQSDTWTSTTRIPTLRTQSGTSYGAFAATLGDKIHVIAGGDTPTTTKLKNEVYSPVTDSWTSKVSVPTGYNGGIVGVWDAAIVVGGGSSMHKYAQATDAWTTGTRLASAVVAWLPEPVQPSGVQPSARRARHWSCHLARSRATCCT
jgi:hypothetical protein